MVQSSDCSHYGPQQQRLAEIFQDATGGERNLRVGQDLNSFLLQKKRITINYQMVGLQRKTRVKIENLNIFVKLVEQKALKRARTLIATSRCIYMFCDNSKHEQLMSKTDHI